MDVSNNIFNDGWNVTLPPDTTEEETEPSNECDSKVEEIKGRKRIFSLFEPIENQSTVEEEQDASKTAEVVGKEAWRISFYKRAFPVKRYDAGFPDAARKVYMDNRRPLWLPQQDQDKDYFDQASYFSEVLARDQLKRQAVLEKIYKPNFGEYAYCRSESVGKTYISKYMKGVHCCKFSPNGDYLIIGTGNGTVQVCNMADKTTSVHCIRGYNRRITSINFLPKDKEVKTFFASSLTGRVYMGKYEEDKWKLYAFLKEINNEINAMDINKSGDYMATAGKDSHIRIYNPNRRKLVHLFLKPGTTSEEDVLKDAVAEDGHFRRICALKFNPDDPNMFITGGWDDILKVWDVRTVNPVQSIAGPHLTGNSLDIWGRVLLTGQWTCNESVQLWDMRTSKCLATVKPMNRPLCYAGEFMNAVQFIRYWGEDAPIAIPGSVGDLVIAGGSGTKALEVISVKENMILHSTEEKAAVSTIDHFRSLIAYGTVNHLYGTLSFFPFVGKLSKEMKFKDKKTEDKMLKQFSEYGNPMGWHEVAFDIDFMEAFKDPSEKTVEETCDKPSKDKQVRKRREELGKEDVMTYDIKDPE
ncbi:uncharacterized protein [Halyomorpha halys]|uniref:uncharacterized protein n=1 Tax=Halyomorpha halys TaxID=286706 RepID=UPI0006D51C38|nr:pre-mRNA-processing factor 19-like [Halyomorpha halys]